MDVLKAESIYSLLEEELKNKIKISVFESLASTNDALKEAALKGGEEGLVFIAGEQTGGKGRLGRSFFSPGGSGIYMSILLRPFLKAEKALNITTAAAVAVCRALEKSGASSSGIKWVNDIFVDGKKVCGILTEAGINGESGFLGYAVLGIGINVYSPKNDFPEELKSIAGSVFTKQRENLRNTLCADIINEFFSFYSEGVEKGTHTGEYIRRSIVLGKNALVIQGDSQREAFIEGITENCELSVLFRDGERALLSSGEISLRV